MKYNRRKKSIFDKMEEKTAELSRSTKLAIAKILLRSSINEYPKNEREKIEERIRALEQIDKKANFFNLEESDLLPPFNPNMPNYAERMSYMDYLRFISDDKLFEIVPIDILAKLLMNTKYQALGLPKLFHIREQYGDDYIEYIMKQENPLEILSEHVSSIVNPEILEKIKEYPKTHSKDEIDLFFRNILIINSKATIITKDIIANLKSVEDILNIENILRPAFHKANFDSKDGLLNRTNLCMYLYGNEFGAIKNLVYKYGADLEFSRSPEADDISKIMELNPKHYQRIIALYPTISMMGLSEKDIAEIDEARLKELSEIQSVFSIIREMKIIVDFDSKDPKDVQDLIDYFVSQERPHKFIPYLDLQDRIIKIYENEYNRVAYDPKKHAKRLNELSEKLGVEIYEVDYENLSVFSGCARIENAYHSEKVKSGDKKYSVDENILYDGLATTYYDSTNLAFVYQQAVDVIGGYTKLTRMQNMAPWDFVSWRGVSEEIAPENIPFNRYSIGIQFRFPRNVTKMARLGTVEMTYYNFVFNGSEYKKVEPDFYLYEYEEGSKFNPKNPKSIEANPDKYSKIVTIGGNNESFMNWFESIREAKRTGRIIVLFDRYKILDVYKNEILELNKKLIDDQTSTEDKIKIMGKMIELFENCSNPIMTTHREMIEDKFFGMYHRDEFYNSLFDIIKRTIEKNPAEGKQLLEAYRGFCERELSKLTTNTNSRGAGNAARSSIEGRMFDGYKLEEAMIRQLDKISVLEGKVYEEAYTQFIPSEYLKELMTRNRSEIGGELHYDVPGAIHGVEHADKVMLLGDAIAKMEELSEHDRKLVAIACMLHDWMREDNSSNATHGEVGAEKIITEFKKGHLDFLGIDNEDVPIIASAVAYHSHAVDNSIAFKKSHYFDRGKIYQDLFDYRKRLKLKEPESKEEYLSRAKIIASILKDADNLDRYRFTHEWSRERPTFSNILTESGKSTEIRLYAQFLNQQYAKMMLEQNYPNALLDADENTDYVDLLQSTRDKVNRTLGYLHNRDLRPFRTRSEQQEFPIPIDELWDKIYNLRPKLQVNRKRSKVLASALEAASDRVGMSDMNSAIHTINVNSDKTNQQVVEDEKKREE